MLHIAGECLGLRLGHPINLSAQSVLWLMSKGFLTARFPTVPMLDLSPVFNALLCSKGGADVHTSRVCYLPPSLNVQATNRFSETAA